MGLRSIAREWKKDTLIDLSMICRESKPLAHGMPQHNVGSHHSREEGAVKTKMFPDIVYGNPGKIYSALLVVRQGLTKSLI